MGVPDLRPADALCGLRLGVSVSDSTDLARLGLTSRHVELALAEIARSVLLGRGGLVYGGRATPSGFTQFLIHEVNNYGSHPEALTLCLAAPEHQKLSVEELDSLDCDLGIRGKLICLDPAGNVIDNGALPQAPEVRGSMNGRSDHQASYSAMRRYIGKTSDARVILGGQLKGFKGAMPGIIEEAIYTVEAKQPLFVIAGFGGAAALVAQTLGIDDLDWAPNEFPERPDDHRIDESLCRLQAAAHESQWSSKNCGLNKTEMHQLAASYRPKEIASLIANGLANIHA